MNGFFRHLFDAENRPIIIGSFQRIPAFQSYSSELIREERGKRNQIIARLRSNLFPPSVFFVGLFSLYSRFPAWCVLALRAVKYPSYLQRLWPAISPGRESRPHHSSASLKSIAVIRRQWLSEYKVSRKKKRARKIGK